MARQFFANVTAGVTANNKEAAEILKERDQLANIDYVKVDYAAFARVNNVKVTTQDLADYIKTSIDVQSASKQKYRDCIVPG